MARDFTSSSLSGAVDLSAYSTIAISFWFYADTFTSTSGQYNMLVELTADGFATSGGIAIYNSGAAAEQLVIAHNGGGGVNRTGLTRPSTGAWHHCLLLSDFTQSSVATELRAWIDGSEGSFSGSTGTAQSDTAVHANSTLYVGRRNNSTLPFDGKFAELAIFRSLPDAAQISALASGVSPLIVLPNSLVHYWPLIGRLSPEIDVRRGSNLTLQASPANADHPRVIYPRRRQWSRRFSTAGSGTTYTLTPSGGMTLGGAVPQLRTRVQPVSGGLAFAGAVPQLRTRVQPVSGGIIFGGTAPLSMSAIWTLAVSGGLALGGAVSLIRTRIMQATGGITLGGTVPLIRTRVAAVAGGVLFGGTAAIAFHESVRTIVGSGGISFGGTAAIVFSTLAGASSYLLFKHRRNKRR